MKANPATTEPLPLEAELVPAEPKIELDLPPAASAQVGLVRVENPTPMALIQQALDRGADLAMVEKLMDLRDRDDARTARMAFDADFAAFKAEAIQIIKNIEVNDGPLKGKKYADLAAVVDAATPALSKHNLGASWKLTKDDKDWMEVTCFLRHSGGHTEQTSMGGPPDTGGAKNPIQARGSTKSYLERYTFLAITGLAAKGQDTDGNTAADWAMDHIHAIEGASTLDELHKVYVDAYKAAADMKDKATQKAIVAAKDNRKKELLGGGK